MEDGQVESKAEASPFFGGSIAEAISTAKTWKRTLIVYISGENNDCAKMNQTTWKNLQVQKLLKEQFVTLRLPERSNDAAHFFAMYPYRGVPSISIINSNGRRLNCIEGYTQPDEFLGLLEQSLAVQAAATIVAALASASPSSTALSTQSDAVSTSISSDNLEHEEGNSSSIHDDIRTTFSPAEENFENHNDGEIDISNSSHLNCLDGTSEPREGKRSSLSKKQNKVSKLESSEVEAEHTLDSSPCNVLLHDGLSSNAGALTDLGTKTHDQNVGMDASGTDDWKVRPTFQEEAPKICRQAVDVFLIQVRLTNGKCIQKSFDPKDKLAAVKTFVDQNRDDGNDIYSLAVPYPRKVFSQEDMEKSLLELSFENRATLVLVRGSLQPKYPASESLVEQAPTGPGAEASGSPSGVWKIFSYLNPLSYFSGSSDGSNNSETGSSSWQYEPNPNLRTLIQQGTGDRYGASNVDVSEPDASKSKKSQERSWGGNIHTLRHSDSDDAFKRGNAFWNGNSTQFGGDDSRK